MMALSTMQGYFYAIISNHELLWHYIYKQCYYEGHKNDSTALPGFFNVLTTCDKVT